jgi:hypothetical protein
MRKGMESLLLANSFMALMSAPAIANNSMICAVQAITPQKPSEAPPLAECKANGTNPTLRVTPWTSGRCDVSNTQKNFCELEPVKVFDKIWIYTIVIEKIAGKNQQVCELTGSQFATTPAVDVKDCKAGSTVLH